MVAGAMHPGKPVANLYVSDMGIVITSITGLVPQFSMWSHDVVSTSILLAGDLKIAQYRKRSAYDLFSLMKHIVVNSQDPATSYGHYSGVGYTTWFLR